MKTSVRREFPRSPIMKPVCPSRLFSRSDPPDEAMKAVIITGFVLMPISCIPCCYFQDPPATDEDSSLDEVGLRRHASFRTRRWGPFRAWHVPVILAVFAFLTSVGAGMTEKFFNLFFIEEKDFSPKEICWLQTAYPLVIAGFMKLTQTCSRTFGRAQVSLASFSCSVFCLWLMSRLHSVPALLVIFFIRGGFANSSYPLDRSIIMDFTPSSQRGRWNAIESVTSMTWSGSAFLGGILADAKDYRFTFMITALLYSLGCVAYVPLVALVPRQEARLERAATAIDIAGAAPAGPQHMT